MDHDGHFTENIVDESIDVAKIVETQMIIEASRNAISKLKSVGFRMNNELLKYSIQLSMLSILLSKHLLSDIEYKKIKIKLMKKYNIPTELYL